MPLVPSSSDPNTLDALRDPVARSAAQQGGEIPVKWKPTLEEPVPVARCRAVKQDGTRCKRWGMRGTTKVIIAKNGETWTGGLCPNHGGHLPHVKEHANSMIEAARLRIIDTADAAVDTMIDLMTNAPDAVRHRAAADILDRAGIKGPVEIDVTVRQEESAADRVQRRIAELAARVTPAPEAHEDEIEIVDAELDE